MTVSERKLPRRTAFSHVMGIAYIGWLISIGILIMRVKPKAVHLACQCETDEKIRRTI